MSRITNYAVGLTLNTEGLEKGVKNARAEFNKIARDLVAAQEPLEKYSRNLDRIDAALKRNIVTEAQHARLMQHYAKGLPQPEVPKPGPGFLAGPGGQVLSGMGLYWGISGAVSRMKDLVEWTITLGAKLEQANIQFGVLSGSDQGGAKLVQELRDLTKITPIAFTEYSQAGRMLLSYGLEAEKVAETVKLLGIVTLGDSEKMKNLSLAFAQMVSKGKLQSQDLRQMTEAAFNPLLQMAKDTGINLGELQKYMEEGAITAEMVGQSFRHATESGGIFFGMQEKSLDTTLGQWRAIKAEIENIVTDIGEQLNPALLNTAKITNQGLKGLETITKHGISGDYQYNVIEALFGGAASVIGKEITGTSEDTDIRAQLEKARKDKEEHDANMKMIEHNAYLNEFYFKLALRDEKEYHEMRMDEVRVKQKLLQDQIRGGEDAMKRIGQGELAPAVTRGSHEAYKVMVDAIFNAQKAKMAQNDPQIMLLKAQKEELVKVNKNLDDLKEDKVARIRN